MFIEMVFIFFLVLVNATLSLSEMAVVSSKKMRLSQWASEGRRGAQTALRLANDPGKMLSTVQVGITVVGVLSGVFSGAQSASYLQSEIVQRVPLLEEYAHMIAIAVMVSIVTFLNIVLGELLPKRIALQSPESLATIVARPLEIMSKFMRPVVYLLDGSTQLFLILVGKHNVSLEQKVTEEEIKNIVKEGSLAGVIDQTEKEMMERVLALGDRSIHSVMTPRPDVVFIDISESFAENRAKITSAPHSHFPLTRGSLDDVLGTVHIKDIYAAQITSSEDLYSLLTPPVFIPETSGVMHIFDMFRKTGVHIAFIIDEYGSVQGIVTLTDLLESIVGIMPSIDEQEDASIFERNDGSFLIDGAIPIEEFKKQFKISQLPNEEKAGFHTLAGFVLSMFGCIPKAGDTFKWQDFVFEVVDMDGNRIDKILLNQTVQADQKGPQDDAAT